MKRLTSILLAIVLSCCSVIALASAETDAYMQNILVDFADDVGLLKMEDMITALDKLGYTYIQRGPGMISLEAPEGTFTLMFFNMRVSGEVLKILSDITYTRDDYSYEVIAETYGASQTYKIMENWDEKEYDSLQSLIDHYNHAFGGNVTLSASEASLDEKIETTVRARVLQKYNGASVQRVTINPNLGTAKTDDVIILVYLSWSVNTDKSTGRSVLETYSKDLSGYLKSNYDQASEITIFWEAPKIQKTGTFVKFSYTK